MPDADKLMAHNSKEAGKTTCRSMWTWALVHVCTICLSIWVCCRALNIPTQTAPTGALLCRRTTETVKTFQVGPQQTWTGKWKVQHRSTLTVMVPIWSRLLLQCWMLPSHWSNLSQVHRYAYSFTKPSFGATCACLLFNIHIGDGLTWRTMEPATIISVIFWWYNHMHMLYL